MQLYQLLTLNIYLPPATAGYYRGFPLALRLRVLQAAVEITHAIGLACRTTTAGIVVYITDQTKGKACKASRSA